MECLVEPTRENIELKDGNNEDHPRTFGRTAATVCQLADGRTSSEVRPLPHAITPSLYPIRSIAESDSDMRPP